MTRSTVRSRDRAACILLAALAVAPPFAAGLAGAAVPAAAALVAAAAMTSVAAAEAVCPYCKAPLEPGAQFCSNCGHKLDAPVAAAEDKSPALAGVVQLVSACDSEVTSTWASMEYGSSFRIDSIIGSAFVVGPGEVITDSNLLTGAKEIVLKSAGGRSFPARVVGIDRMIGVALLAADIPGVTALPLRTGEPVRPGETLTVLGFPGAGQASGEVLRSSGVVSGMHRGGVGMHPIEDYFQTDASLPRGIGGGPFLDSRGRVVGMASWQVQSGIGMGMPAEWIDRALTWIRSGTPQRAWMGAYVERLDAETRKQYGLPSEVAMVIEQVFPDSPAAAAGLRRGDGLIEVQGEAAATVPRLHERLLAARPGDQVTLAVRRKEETLKPTVTLAPRPDRPRLTGADSLRFFGGVGIAARDNGTLVVEDVTPGSTTAYHKVAPGDVLLSVLSKKDWDAGAKDNARWRSVHTQADVEERVATAYSDLDFCLGLRFKKKDGDKEEFRVCRFLTQIGPL